jgi:tellurite resistance protein TehA-like permease
MTPIWIFPAYPLLITGPFASNLAPHLPANSALQVILSGSMLQSLGFLVSLSIYSAFLYRLMTQKLPLEALRPGMFISVGPSGFTSAGVIGMARSLPRAAGNDFMGPGMGAITAKISVVMANWWGIWLWGLAIWWFLVSCGAHFNSAARGRLTFSMTWYSFIFPNTALTTSTFAVSTALHGDLANEKGIPHSARPFQVLGVVMTVGLVLMWFFVFFMMIRAVCLRQILWPQMQEDRDEGGWGKDSRARKGEKVSVRPSRVPSTTNSAMQSAMQVNQVGRASELRLTSSPVDSVKE